MQQALATVALAPSLPSQEQNRGVFAPRFLPDPPRTLGEDYLQKPSMHTLPGLQALGGEVVRSQSLPRLVLEPHTKCGPDELVTDLQTGNFASNEQLAVSVASLHAT